MDANFDRSKSLQELEHDDWGEPVHNSYLITTCHRPRRKSLCDFTPEDLRMMILQQIGLDYLVPLALEQLEIDPLLSGDSFPGALLENVISIAPDYRRQHPDLVPSLTTVVNAAIQRVRNKQYLPSDEDLLQRLDDVTARFAAHNPGIHAAVVGW